LTKNTYVFYLTSGSNKIFDKSKLSSRDKESLKTLKKLGLKEKNIFLLEEGLR